MSTNCEDPDSCGAVKKNAELCNDLDNRDATIAAQAKEIERLKKEKKSLMYFAEWAGSCKLENTKGWYEAFKKRLARIMPIKPETLEGD